nr:hypothetical protein Itr_chr03CG26060 [Ipomoea trifida]
MVSIDDLRRLRATAVTGEEENVVVIVAAVPERRGGVGSMSVENPGLDFPAWNRKLHRNGGTTPAPARADKKERRKNAQCRH